ncbi:DUF3078 domain-containing protein [Aquimarina intermedia]|uniref:DUF3078 family protein n=1 Tax=Aquimarina intermedia TaxID=350814 RepID=A0A5S5CE76_9FLAO|nr:DUF3078 domain-containing protein [Aquimarina intermedia]TYP76958.1 Protein of unknown function (DUF3078) [Aquimarina intermedia]
MRNYLLYIISIVCSVASYSQQKNVEKDSLDGWKTQGKVATLINQAAFNNNWQGGGTTNVAGNVTIKFEFNYRQGSLTLNNRFLADYGLTKIKDKKFTRKTNDRMELNSVLSKRIKTTNWYYSYFINFKSQFDKGFRFVKIPDTEEEIRIEETRFFSPAYIQTGPGILWKKSDLLYVNIAPITARMIFVDNQFTDGEEYEDGDYFGLDKGETSRFEFGGSISMYAKFTIMKNISLENILNLYSNYIEEAYNIDIDYTMNLQLKVNKYISTTLAFQAIYDDNATRGFQIREILGFGLTYTF